MSDSKRPGNRDISDLKARLGLKKGAAAPAAQPRANGGVVAPPGVHLPPPPGVQQPPALPNAAEDPFAAMNAMAAVGTVQRAPEIVIVNDGRPVENLAHKSIGATVARIAIPALIALVLGVAIGKIGESASSYNDAINDAKVLLGDKSKPASVAGLKQTISQIDTLLDQARTQNQFRPNAKIDEDLAKLSGKLAVEKNVFAARMHAIDSELAQNILMFFAGVQETKAMIDAHLESLQYDRSALAKGKEKAADAALKETENVPLAGQPRYAVMLQVPTKDDPNVDFGAKIVQLGGVYCAGAKVATAGCGGGDAPDGLGYRTELDRELSQGSLAAPENEAVPPKKIVPLLPGSIRDQFLKGADGIASEVYYQRRLRAVYDRICKRDQNDKCNSSSLLDLGNRVETRLDSESKRGKKFSFFM